MLYWPLASSVVLLNGFRHVLSIPAEWRANWIFQITESQGRAEWMSALERFVFPVAAHVLGWPMALRMTVLQRPLAGVVAKYVALLGAVVPILSVVIVAAIQVSFLFPIFLAIFGGLWIFLRIRRREGWGEAKLIYEDLPAVVANLGIKEITYAGTAAQLRRTLSAR